MEFARTPPIADPGITQSRIQGLSRYPKRDAKPPEFNHALQHRQARSRCCEHGGLSAGAGRQGIHADRGDLGFVHGFVAASGMGTLQLDGAVVGRKGVYDSECGR